MKNLIEISDTRNLQLCFFALIKFFLGWGVFATNTLSKGSFLLEYVGELISASEAETREADYQKQLLGSYLFFFSYEGKSLW